MVAWHEPGWNPGGDPLLTRGVAVRVGAVRAGLVYQEGHMTSHRLEFGTIPLEGHQREQVRVMQGDHCVVLKHESADYREAEVPGLMVLDPKTARALGRRIIRAAGYSEEPRVDEG